jgi:hypothetical protein
LHADFGRFFTYIATVSTIFALVSALTYGLT